MRAYFVVGGRIASERTLPPGGGAALEVEAGLAAARRTAGPDTAAPPGSLEELLLVGTFLRRPPPELRVVRLDRETILRTARSLAAVHAEPPHPPARRRTPDPPHGPALFET